MPSIARILDAENPVVNENGALLPLHQAAITAGSDAYIVLPCSPQPASNVLGTNTTINFDIERDTVKQINDIVLRFTVSCSTADVECLPINYWMDRVIIEAERGSSDELIHLFPENWIVWDYLTEDRVGREISRQFSNYHVVKKEGGEKYSLSQRTKFKAGETRDVYLKIPALFFHLNAIDMSHVRSDLRIRLEMSNDIVVSGSASNLSLDSLNLVVRNFAEEDFDHNYRVQRHTKNKHKYIYLDTERYQVNNKTLTAGQTTKIELDQFTGKMGFAVVVIKPSSNPKASDKSKIKFTELGPNATFDITNPSSQSLLGQGTALKESHLYQIFCKQTGNPHVSGLYLIPFAKNPKKAVAGVINGFTEMVGLRDYLEITPDSAGLQETHTIDIGTTASSGTYRYCFENGGISDQDVDYNDSTTDIEAVLNAMPELVERDITASVNNNLASTTSQTITFSSDSGKVSDELGKISIIGNGIPKVTGTSVSTVGRRGFSTSGSNYEINVYMFKFKALEVHNNGRLTCHDL